jgi:hypothetical protein
MILVLVLLIVIAAAVYILDPAFIYMLFPSNVYVSGVSLEINNATQISCFGNVVQALPGFNITRALPFSYSFNLTNSCKAPHNVTAINVINNGFTTRVVNPVLKYEMFGGNRVPFSVLITPSSGFNGGVMTIQVNVT